MPTIRLDGEQISISAGDTLRSVVPSLRAGCCVAIIRPVEKEQSQSGSIALHTTAGEVRIDVVAGQAGFFTGGATRDAPALHWHDRYAAAFGPFTSAIRPARKPGLYERGDVILGCGGYDPQRSYLIFSKSRHSADHGADETGGVIGKVIAGRAVLERWAPGDRITRIEPVIRWADTSRSFTTTDPGLPLEDGMQIVTRVLIMAQGYSEDRIVPDAAGSVEHLLFACRNGCFTVSRAASTHILDEALAGSEVAADSRHPRREGTVTVRNSGISAGGIYIYREDVHSSLAHSIAGQVVSGIELVRLAKEGDVFAIDARPGRIDLLGRPLEKAQEIANDRAFSLSADKTGAGRIVVAQEPGTTLEVLRERSVKVETAPVERVVDIVLDDAKAPASCAIFRKLTGLARHDAGMLPLHFKFEDVFLFKPDVPSGLKIIPENTPADEVPAACLAITNDSRKGSGMVGVRLSANREFGPTSEPFEGTNIIGRVLDTAKLKKFRDSDTVYIREAKP